MGRRRKKRSAQNILDFRPSVDRVVRRGKVAFLVSTDGTYADIEVDDDVMTPMIEGRFRALTGERRDRMIEVVQGTPFLSREGRLERLAALGVLFVVDG